MRFSEIIGQQKIIEKLVASVKGERVSHAIMLTGPEGTGKLALAIAFGQYISCLEKSNGDSCGTCPSCVKYEKLIHPDLHFVYPVFKKGSMKEPISALFIDSWREMVGKSAYFNLNQWLKFIGVKNQQGIIYTYEAKEILRIVGLKTYESEYKVIVIWLPEKLHSAPANKLLKVIEEPPEKTLFLLVSEDPDLVLPTIRSRCQFIRVPVIETDELAATLGSKEGVNDAMAKTLAHVSRGNRVAAEEMIEDSETRKNHLENFIQIMRMAHNRNIQGLSDWTDDYSRKGRETQKNFLEYCQNMIRENFIKNIGQDPDKLVFMSDGEAQFSVKFHKFIHQGNAELLVSDFAKAWSHISANGNAKIVLFDMTIQIIRHIKLADSSAQN